VNRVQNRLLIHVFVAVSCIAASFPEFPVKPVSEYANVVAKSGVVVAAIPMEEPLDQQKYFGMDLRSRGYVPVFLVIENQTSTESFLLGKEGLRYSPARHSTSTLANPARPSRDDKALAVTSYLPYYGIVATVMDSKSKVLRQNILKRELQSTTLSPGTSAHGFIFIPARWQHSTREKVELTIPLTKPRTGETVILDLAL
jgi:hypothetical protein